MHCCYRFVKKKKIKIYLSLTHLWQRTPPYTRFTVFLRLHIRDLSMGLAGWIPLNLSLHWPHLGIFFGFLRYWYTNFPPGVRTLQMYNTVYYYIFLIWIDRHRYVVNKFLIDLVNNSNKNFILYLINIKWYDFTQQIYTIFTHKNKSKHNLKWSKIYYNFIKYSNKFFAL